MTAADPPAGPASRFAAIDVGTNSIRLVVAEALGDRGFRVIDEEKVTTRLGRGLVKKGRLSDDAMEASAEAIAHFRGIAEGCDARRVRAAATCAVREAENGDAFVALVRARAGLELDVLPPEEEARLAFLSVSRAFDLAGMNVAVADVGGGSTELVLASGHVVERICPLALGAVRLTERHGTHDVVDDDAYRALRKSIRREIKRIVGRPPFPLHLLIGTGGTFTNLGAIVMQRSGGPDAAPPFPVRGHELQRSELRHVLDELRVLPARRRARVPGLNPERADIIVAGLAIVDGLLKHLGVNRLRIHDQGIREGLLHEMAGAGNGLRPEPEDAGPDRLAAVRRFAEKCGVDDAHATQVARLSLRMYDELAAALAPAPWASAETRRLLQAAALLCDVGYLIGYAGHHKHSEHLILHSGLAGFTRRELRIVAQAARYHRGARPKSRHAAFAALEPADRDLVRRLAAILRLAVGLDRSHRQRVRDVAVRLESDAIVIDVVAGEEPQVELWGAERTRRLFERVFGRAVRLRPAAAPAPEVLHVRD